MKICLLASGSKGNCTYIETSANKFLIDIGITCLKAERKLQDIGINPKEITGIFITHAHIDHISGLRVFCKKYNPIVYITKKMYNEISKYCLNANYVFIEHQFQIDNLSVNIIKTSHDVNDSNGYIFEYEKKSIVYITDTGYINVKYHNKLKNKNMYVIESNHDIELLMNGNRPYHLKQRILGDKGHLSNNDSAYYISQFIGNNTNCVILAHLSEDNNNTQLAKDVLLETLKENNKKVEKIVIANQNERTELIEI